MRDHVQTPVDISVLDHRRQRHHGVRGHCGQGILDPGQGKCLEDIIYLFYLYTSSFYVYILYYFLIILTYFHLL